MSTRGAVGFRLNGQDKVGYNHSDSYPECLGQDTVDFLHGYLNSHSIADFSEKVAAIQFYDPAVMPAVPPTAEQKAKFSKFADLRVASRSLDDWHCLLCNLQGIGYFEAGIMPDSHEFLRDSLFCEWAYIVNLDSRKLEIYQGFQTFPHADGRYSSYPPRGKNTHGTTYYPVALLLEIDLDKIREDKIDLTEYVRGAIKKKNDSAERL